MIETLRGLQLRIDSSQAARPFASYARADPQEEYGRIDFHRSAVEICNRLRGFQPWPGAFTTFRGRNLNVWSAKALPEATPEGQLLVDGDRLLVGCGGSTALGLIEVQPEGKKRISAKNFIHGYRPKSGEKLGL